MKKKIIFGITVCLFIMASMLSFNMSQQRSISDISLNNIAALSSAQAEDWDDHYCMLISTDLCYINTNTYPFPPIVIYGLHRY